MPRETIRLESLPVMSSPWKVMVPALGLTRPAIARSVGADQGDDLPLGHVQGNALDGLNAAVMNL